MVFRFRHKVLLMLLFSIALFYIQLVSFLQFKLSSEVVVPDVRKFGILFDSSLRPGLEKVKMSGTFRNVNYNKLPLRKYVAVKNETLSSFNTIFRNLNTIFGKYYESNGKLEQQVVEKPKKNSSGSFLRFDLTGKASVQRAKKLTERNSGYAPLSSLSSPVKKTIRYNYFENLHYRIQNFTSDNDVKMFYKRDKISRHIFEKAIDVTGISPYLKYLFPTDSNTHDDRIRNQLNLKLLNTTKKTILFYSPSGATQKDFNSKNCNVKDCILTSNRSKFYETDAVVFRGFIPFERKPPHSVNQIWIWSNLESGENSPKVASIPNVANWSETYRRDSVIVSPYERFTPHDHISALPKTPIRNFAANKTRKVAWFVSNCNAKNHRMSFVKELKKYIDVDIYGRCGTMNCPRYDKSCFKKLKTEYKFYLAFENTNCKDYITEKLYWNAYWNNVLPIVMGAHPNDYKVAVPPRSFIHIDLFESPKQLAGYLKFLDRNDDFYNSYFLWKDTGSFIDTKSICRICAMVHVGQYFHTHYKDANEWWSGKNVCKKSKGTKYYSTWKDKSNIPLL